MGVHCCLHLTCTSYGFRDTGIQTEEQEQQEEEEEEEEEESHISGPILTILYMHIHIDLSYHPVVSKVDYH